MARGERVGRLRVGDDNGSDNPALPRLPDRRDGSIGDLGERGGFLDFTVDVGLTSWRYELDGLVIEKSIVVPSRQNIVHSTFRLLSDGRRVRLRLRPLINFRPLEAPVSEAQPSGYTLTVR